MPQQAPARADDLLGPLVGNGTHPRVLEDFRPLHQSLEWALARAYYERAGASAFTGGAVPFGVTSSGQLSADAAAILCANLESTAETGGAIRCLELGPGSGLFAKLLLDELRRRSREQRRDYYERTTLVLADSSRAMLDAISANGVLAEHEGRYELVHSDPSRPHQAAVDGEGLRAIFLNYVLDSLPASILRRAATGIEQLSVRTSVDPEVALPDYTALSLPQLLELASAQTVDPRLADLHPALVIDVRYEPVVVAELPEAAALDGILPMGIGETVVHGHGAIACLRGFVERLGPGGFVLFNDFDSCAGDRTSDRGAPYSTYGGAIAVGLNFDQLAQTVTRWPRCSIHAPAADERLVSRLLGRDLDAATAACFAERFDRAVVEARRTPRELARKLIDDRQTDAAREAFAQAMTLAPGDWTLYEEAASLAYASRDFQGAQALARRGIELNPLAVGLWNVLGDCELHARHPRSALDCYERAIELNDREVRGRYNAAYALSATRDHRGALRMIADAMTLDDGTYRDRLLGKQARILDRIANQRQRDRLRSRDRVRPSST